MASKSLPSKSIATTKDAQSSVSPNQSLYVTNLPEKMNKNELKRALYMIFSTYGPVLDVVTRRMGMRGQAHVVYRDIQTSTQAMRALQGFEFFDKRWFVIIAYAKGQSQIISKLRGTFEMPNSAPIASESTELQKSIFNAPPSSIPSKSVETTATRPAEHALPNPPQGVKRPREDDEGSEDGDAPMEEEEDDDASMEASSDED